MINVGDHNNTGECKVGFEGKDVSLGMQKTTYNKAANGMRIYVGKQLGSDGYAGQVPIGRMSMFVLRCRWSATPENPDILELFRVYEDRNKQPDLSREPVSRMEMVIDQKKLDSLAAMYSSHKVDEIRIGANLLSVLRGTVPTGTKK